MRNCHLNLLVEIMSRRIRIADFEEIYNFHIRKRCSGHDKIVFQARLTERQSEEWKNLVNKVIRADFIKEGSKEEQESVEKNVFLGNVHAININYTNSWFCDVSAYSFSALMDKEPKNRIFQDTEKNLLDILKKVCGDYSGIVLKEQGTEQISVPAPVIQYQETDWHFLVRITKKYGLEIVANQDDTNVNEGTLWIGKIDRKAKKISEDTIVEKSYSKNGIIYKCILMDVLDIGDKVSLHNREYRITGCDFYLEDNALIRKYTFCEDKTKKEISPKLEGLILKAEVIALEGDGKDNGQVQLKFDMEEEKAKTPLWIDWAVSFSDDNTGIYNMPSIGEKVLVYIMNGDGTELVAKGNLRTSSVDKDLKVTDKLLRVGEKQILLDDRQISIKNKNTIVTIEEEKITIQTEKANWILDTSGLSIDTNGKPVDIKSGNVKIDGDNIEISCKRVDIKSNSINLKGIVKVT